MKQIDDFKKAVKKRIFGSILGTIIGGFFAFILLSISYSFYNLEQDLSLITGFGGILIAIISIGSFIDAIEFILNPKKLDNYVLCKRCKCLINKDKIFCNDCRYDIRRAFDRSEDKQYFDEYKKMIKQEKEKK